jgi:hypothetical protein
MPSFSKTDVREDTKFVPDFFNVAPAMPHGALVLSHDHAAGLCWYAANAAPVPIDRIASVSAPLRFSWRKQ